MSRRIGLYVRTTAPTERDFAGRPQEIREADYEPHEFRLMQKLAQGVLAAPDGSQERWEALNEVFTLHEFKVEFPGSRFLTDEEAIEAGYRSQFEIPERVRAKLNGGQQALPIDEQEGEAANDLGPPDPPGLPPAPPTDPPDPPEPPFDLHDPLFPDDMPIGEARRMLRELAPKGHRCPACNQRVQRYDRKLNGTMLRSLVAFYREYGLEWGSLPDLRRKVNLHHSNQEAQLAHFGLFEEERRVRRDDGGRAGVWRVTALGERWLKGEATVREAARQYNQQGHGTVGEPVTASDVLGTRFDLREVLDSPFDDFWDASE